MSARPIGEIIKPIVAQAVGLAHIQEFLDTFHDPCVRRVWIDALLESETISANEAQVLIEHNVETAE